MDAKVWIGNLGKYNEGELVGKWFTLPISEDEVREAIGLNGMYEEYEIMDNELPFEISPYLTIGQLNELAELLDEVSYEDALMLAEVMNFLGCTFEDAYHLWKREGRVYVYPEDMTLEDIAKKRYETYVDEDNILLRWYIDWERVAKDMVVNNPNFSQVGNRWIEIDS